MLSTQEKLIQAKEIQKDWEEYYGYYVALDEKDRLIGFGKTRQEVLQQASAVFSFCSPFRFKIYRIFDAYKRQLIKSLLNDAW